MLENIKKTITSWDDRNPWTNVYGLARSIIALSSLLTLLINHPSLIMKPASGISSYPACKMNLSLFCLGENNYMMLNLLRWVCIAILVLVVIGWRPRITGVLHWYVSYSLQSSLIVIDGGEQAAAVMTFLLLPITLTDPRKWHWSTRPLEGKRTLGKITAFISYFVIRIQVAVLYFHSTVAKLSQQEWVDGTAVYYFALKNHRLQRLFSGVNKANCNKPVRGDSDMGDAAGSNRHLRGAVCAEEALEIYFDHRCFYA